MNNIKRGTSINGGMVLTDMPIKALVALRDAVDDAIRNSRKDDSDRLLTDIISAIDAANDEGYMVNINGTPLNPDHLSVDYDEDEDYWDNEDNWDNEDWRECDDDEGEDDWDDDDPYDDTDDEGYDYDPCQVCHRKYCEGCRLHDM